MDEQDKEAVEITLIRAHEHAKRDNESLHSLMVKAPANTDKYSRRLEELEQDVAGMDRVRPLLENAVALREACAALHEAWVSDKVKTLGDLFPQVDAIYNILAKIEEETPRV